MSQLGIVGATTSVAELPPILRDAVSVALAHASAWVPLESNLLDALIRDSLPATHHPGTFADSQLGQFLKAHADRPLVLWYAGNLIELDSTGPETLLETARQQLLESAPLGGELYLNHAPDRQREVSSQRAADRSTSERAELGGRVGTEAQSHR